MDSWTELTGSVDYRALSDSVLLGLTNGSIDLLVFRSERHNPPTRRRSIYKPS